jgi:hypothetical protein
MRKSVIVVLPLALLCSMLADGSAHAQCAPTDKIYIDPRLVPKRPILSREGFSATMNNPNPNAARRNQYLIQQYQQQGQPIAVPYGKGTVLVHPTNPCIQQYIP